MTRSRNHAEDNLRATGAQCDAGRTFAGSAIFQSRKDETQLQEMPKNTEKRKVTKSIQATII